METSWIQILKVTSSFLGSQKILNQWRRPCHSSLSEGQSCAILRFSKSSTEKFSKDGWTVFLGRFAEPTMKFARTLAKPTGFRLLYNVKLLHNIFEIWTWTLLSFVSVIFANASRQISSWLHNISIKPIEVLQFVDSINVGGVWAEI